MSKDYDKLEANSYCIEYDNGQFFIGLAEKNNEDEVDLKGYMYCDDEDFKDFFKRILSQIGKFDEANDRNFIKELFDDVKEGVE